MDHPLRNKSLKIFAGAKLKADILDSQKPWLLIRANRKLYDHVILKPEAVECAKVKATELDITDIENYLENGLGFGFYPDGKPITQKDLRLELSIDEQEDEFCNLYIRELEKGNQDTQRYGHSMEYLECQRRMVAFYEMSVDGFSAKTIRLEQINSQIKTFENAIESLRRAGTSDVTEYDNEILELRLEKAKITNSLYGKENESDEEMKRKLSVNERAYESDFAWNQYFPNLRCRASEKYFREHPEATPSGQLKLANERLSNTLDEMLVMSAALFVSIVLLTISVWLQNNRPEYTIISILLSVLVVVGFPMSINHFSSRKK